jgi:hypothetical protein
MGGSITTWSKGLPLPQSRLNTGSNVPTVSGSSRLGCLKRKRTVRSSSTSTPATSNIRVL